MSGFFGVAGREDVMVDLFYGTDYHSHLGTQRGGMATWQAGRGFERSIHDIRNAPFRTKFTDDLDRLKACMGVGVISDSDDQPLLVTSHLGAYAIAMVGTIRNADALAQRMCRQRSAHFCEMRGTSWNHVELAAALIGECASLPEGIRHAQDQIEGSCSLLLLTPDGLIAARDRYGRTPVVIGRRADGAAHAVTFETCALPNLGYESAHELGPGEVVRITPEGWQTLAAPHAERRVCSFLWIYYGYPASSYEGRNVEAARNACGEALARRETETADFVAGVPDSGVGHGLGLAHGLGLPYRRPFVKYTPTWPRSFMPPQQDHRELVARMKLIPVRELTRGKRILFCDDSIVRGTQLKDQARRLFDAGAAAVHMRPACPALLYGCPFLTFSRSKSVYDLIARRVVRDLEGNGNEPPADYTNPDSDRYARMCETIAREIGVTTLRYQRLDDMVAAIGLPREQLCTYCWDGRG